jgi:hypothetical protein
MARVTPYSRFRWQGVRAGTHPTGGGSTGGVTGKSPTTRKEKSKAGNFSLLDSRGKEGVCPLPLRDRTRTRAARAVDREPTVHREQLQ